MVARPHRTPQQKLHALDQRANQQHRLATIMLAHDSKKTTRNKANGTAKPHEDLHFDH